MVITGRASCANRELLVMNIVLLIILDSIIVIEKFNRNRGTCRKDSVLLPFIDFDSLSFHCGFVAEVHGVIAEMFKISGIMASFIHKP
jgi:hypothetical protein